MLVCSLVLPTSRLSISPPRLTHSPHKLRNLPGLNTPRTPFPPTLPSSQVLLRSYFESQGVNATAVLPKSKLLQQKLCSRQHAPDATAQQFSAASESLGTPDSTSAVKASAPTQDNAGSAAAAGVTVSAMPATEQGRRAVTPHRVTSSKKGASRSSKESSWVVKSRDDYGDDEDDDDSLFDGDWEAAFKLK
ncbi:unnamed protein product [Closterium sp. NIES-53]